MNDICGQLRADSLGISKLCRHIDSSPFGELVVIPDEMPFLATLVHSIPVSVERSVKVATKKRERCHYRGFWSDLRDEPRNWFSSAEGIEGARRAEWYLEADVKIRKALPKAEQTLDRTLPFEGMPRFSEIIDYYELDRRPVWKSIYFFGLDLNNAATHVLAVWLLGGHAVDWEGTFPDGRVVGYFFGGSPDVKG